MDKNIGVFPVSVYEFKCLFEMLDNIVILLIMCLNDFMKVDGFLGILDCSLLRGSENSSNSESSQYLNIAGSFQIPKIEASFFIAYCLTICLLGSIMQVIGSGSTNLGTEGVNYIVAT